MVKAGHIKDLSQSTIPDPSLRRAKFYKLLSHSAGAQVAEVSEKALSRMVRDGTAPAPLFTSDGGFKLYGIDQIVQWRCIPPDELLALISD